MLPNQWSPYRGDDPPPEDNEAEKMAFLPAAQVLQDASVDLAPLWLVDPRFSRQWVVVENGEPVYRRLYTIGALANALGKRPVTIRLWIRNGYLPEPTLRSPDIPKTRGDAGRRLWTREQIEALVVIAREEGLIGRRGANQFSQRFVSRVRTLWRQQNW